MVISSCLFLVEVSSAENGIVKTSRGLYVNDENRDRYWVKSRRLYHEYPDKEQRLKKSACVTVKFTIREDGNVYDPSVVAIYPEANGRFENASIRAIKKSKYKPSKMNPEKLPIITTHTFNFIIAEGTKKAHRAKLAVLEKEFDAVCKVDFVLKGKE